MGDGESDTGPHGRERYVRHNPAAERLDIGDTRILHSTIGPLRTLVRLLRLQRITQALHSAWIALTVEMYPSDTDPGVIPLCHHTRKEVELSVGRSRRRWIQHPPGFRGIARGWLHN